MTTPHLVRDFYEQIWNAGSRSAANEILSENFVFRGSLGAELDYRCDILECVFEGSLAFAKMRFGGIHVREFRGHRPSGLPVHWHGAALFRFEQARIEELWVLGDLAGLDANLRSNAGQTSTPQASPLRLADAPIPR